MNENSDLKKFIERYLAIESELGLLKEDKKVAWCSRKNSSKVAFCDGSCKNL